jgi:hypothetical protein
MSLVQRLNKIIGALTLLDTYAEIPALFDRQKVEAGRADLAAYLKERLDEAKEAEAAEAAAEELATKLRAEFPDLDERCENLDDLVIDRTCSIASLVNNGGVDEQIAFLLETHSADEIREALSGS